jgi:pyruvate,water dikinase
LLTDEDQIFFLQHKEIGELIDSGDTEKWLSIANERRKIYPELQQMSFADVSFGIPVPVKTNNDRENSELAGVPVSRGVVEGRVRLVSSMNEARFLKEGEIIVARMTDIGWTPFYSVISGLITEIGSPLSHGAVVAREYGLPAVVSMKGAMSVLQTGQLIRLDAIKGKVDVVRE